MNGQHSWVTVIVLLAVLAVRLVSSQRRRGTGRPGARPGVRGFTASPGPATDPHPHATGTSAPGTSSGTAPGWFTDPFVRHEQRYWSGTAWTEHVLDGGTPAVDPPPPPRR